jgi:tetratricopeptide (TPR) repeat protein
MIEHVVRRISFFVPIAVLAVACAAPSPRERDDSRERVYVLQGADRALDRAIARVESGGPQSDPSLLASLRLTRTGRDSIAAGREDRAFDELERAIEVNGDQGFSYLYLAHLHIAAGDVSQGLVFLERAESLLPASREIDAVVTALLDRAAESGHGPEGRES